VGLLFLALQQAQVAEDSIPVRKPTVGMSEKNRDASPGSGRGRVELLRQLHLQAVT
jgi:hypothetical protein